MGKQEINKIFTGVSALYRQNIISYSPTKDHVEMPFGTNTTKYNQKYNVTLQKKETFYIGYKEIDNNFYYEPERLFIELDKFPLESTIKNEAIKNLENIIIPEKVREYYELLKNNRKGLDKNRIEIYLASHLLNIKEVLKSNDDHKSIVREYLMALVSREDVPVSLIKGGSSVELYTNIKRTTIDIDAHTDNESIKEIINYLTERDKDIYFKVKEEIDYSRKSQIIKCVLIPISRGGVLKKELEDIEIPISFNTVYPKEKLKEIISEFNITKRRLKYLKNASCIVFSREMLLAEKFQSIISKPKDSTRTKDLIDLKLLWCSEIDFNKFRKWLFRKWKNQRSSLTIDEAKNKITENKGVPLIKIKNNFDDAIKMYSIDTSYDECKKLYEILINESLKE